MKMLFGIFCIVLFLKMIGAITIDWPIVFIPLVIIVFAKACHIIIS